MHKKNVSCGDVLLKKIFLLIASWSGRFGIEIEDKAEPDGVGQRVPVYAPARRYEVRKIQTKHIIVYAGAHCKILPVSFCWRFVKISCPECELVIIHVFR